jgi:hypothetical protein
MGGEVLHQSPATVVVVANDVTVGLCGTDFGVNASLISCGTASCVQQRGCKYSLSVRPLR